MGFARLYLSQIRGLSFYKLFGTGSDEGFTFKFNPLTHSGVYAILAVWSDENTAKNGVINSKIHLDAGEKKIHIEDSQDISQILAQNKREANDQAYKFKGFQDAKMYKVAEIPLIVVQELAQRGIMNYNGTVRDKERMKKWLNDPDNKYFRIYKGNV